MKDHHLIILTGPSGAGKSTLVHALLQSHPQLAVSISYTTRPPRGSEKNGVDYHFVDEQTFRSMIQRQAFAEWAEVHGHFYGTAKAHVDALVQKGLNVVFDIDVQGVRQLKKVYPHLWAVLIAPPSLKILEQRLYARATDRPEVIQKRLAKAKWELEQTQLFDFVLVNDQLDKSILDIRAIYRAMTLRDVQTILKPVFQN